MSWSPQSNRNADDADANRCCQQITCFSGFLLKQLSANMHDAYVGCLSLSLNIEP